VDDLLAFIGLFLLLAFGSLSVLSSCVGDSGYTPDAVATLAGGRASASMQEDIPSELRHVLSIEPGAEFPGYLAYGVFLSSDQAPLPLLVRSDDAPHPFVGEASLRDGRAVIVLRSYAGLNVNGFVVGSEGIVGLPVDCSRWSEGSDDVCLSGKLPRDLPLMAIFPGGVDIVTPGGDG
jgi:hypothetical protein